MEKKMKSACSSKMSEEKPKKRKKGPKGPYKRKTD